MAAKRGAVAAKCHLASDFHGTKSASHDFRSDSQCPGDFSPSPLFQLAFCSRGRAASLFFSWSHFRDFPDLKTQSETAQVVYQLNEPIEQL